MKKRIFLLLLCLALLLTGCAASRRTPKQTFRIYGLSGAPGGDAISAVDVDWSERKSLTVDQQAQAALEQLLGACTGPGYRTPIHTMSWLSHWTSTEWYSHKVSIII